MVTLKLDTISWRHSQVQRNKHTDTGGEITQNSVLEGCVGRILRILQIREEDSLVKIPCLIPRRGPA